MQPHLTLVETLSDQELINQEIGALKSHTGYENPVFWETLKSEVNRQLQLNLARDNFIFSASFAEILVDRLFERQCKREAKMMNDLAQTIQDSRQVSKPQALAIINGCHVIHILGKIDLLAETTSNVRDEIEKMMRSGAFDN